MMGLDISIEWDDMSVSDKDAQITGFTDAANVGYLRLNWSGVSYVAQYAKDHGYPDLLNALYPAWNGYNGESYEITAEQMARLLLERDRMIEWLKSAPSDVDDYFKHKVSGAIDMINFAHANCTKQGLRIIFG